MRSPRWLALLAASPRFREAADTALRAAAWERANINLDGFGLMPREATFYVRYSDKGVGWIQGDLVGPDAVGEMVSIAWVHRRDPAVRVAPCDDVGADDVHFFWGRFPAESLRARYGSGLGAPFTVDLPSATEVRWNAFCWPEVWLVVELGTSWTTTHEEALAAEAARFVDEWNRRGDRGVIHNLSPPADVGARRRRLRIDFGSAETSALGEILSAFIAIPGLVIDHFEIWGYE